MSATTVKSVVVSDNDEVQTLLLKFLSGTKQPEDSTKSKKSVPLGQSLKSELKSHRLQKEQNENSPSSTGSNTPVPAIVSDQESENHSKRKRPRRNPVWKFFNVSHGNAYCQKCPYSTKSVYSTNLKVHLKSHHHEQYREVIAAEWSLTATNLLTPAKDDGKVDSISKNQSVGALFSSLKSFGSFPKKLNSRVSLIEDSTETSGCDEKNEITSDRILKRRRLRRHPVWNFFDDLDEKNIGCNMCDFRTVSGFTTNLKMHLRAHHKTEFVQVMELECQQRKEEGCVDNAPVLGKRKKKTAEEIEKMLDEYKWKIEQESSGSNLSSSLNMFDEISALLSSANKIPRFDDASVAEIKSEFDSDDQESPSLSPEDIVNKQIQSELENNNEKLVSEVPLENFRAFMLDLHAMDTSNIKENAVKQARDIALGRFLNAIGVDNVSLLTSSVFVQFILAMDPNYPIPDENSLKHLAESVRLSQPV